MAKGWTLAAVRKNIKVSGVTLAPKRAPKPKPLAQPKSEAALAIAQQKRRINHLKFESFWRQLGGPELKTEQCVVPGRRFSTDYIHEAARVSIELNGGTWSKQPVPMRPFIYSQLSTLSR